MVSATVALNKVITKTPRKLQAADIAIAAFGRIERVPIHVAIELAASVHPFTIITAMLTNTINAKGRL